MVEATFMDRQGQMHSARCVQPWIHSAVPPKDMLLWTTTGFSLRTFK